MCAKMYCFKHQSLTDTGCDQGGLSCLGCSSSCSLATTHDGILSDGSGPLNYGSNAKCQWLVAPVNATQITFNFTEFNTEQGVDVVQLFQCSDASCEDVQLVQELSGSYSSYQSITLDMSYVLVQFASDASTTYSGFTASWTSNAPSPNPVSGGPALTLCGH
jgi:hypothetical protein